jgi:glycosyltransferase involved in cell wall biosynthesis
MNVVHVVPYPVRVSGGHANAIQSFIGSQRAKGINAVGIAPKPEEGTTETNWKFPLAEVDSLWDLRWATITERFKISSSDSLINLHGVNRNYGPLLSDLRRAGVPYVQTSHGQLGFHSAWHWARKLIYLTFVNRDPFHAAGLHLLSRAAARRAHRVLPGYRGAELVQGNLVSAPSLAEAPAISRNELGIPENAFVLLFLGRLDVWVKGLDLVTEAFSRLPSNRMRLVLAGPDWAGGKAKLEELAARLGCRDRMHFLGPLYGDKKWALLRQADLFVSPSRWEAFSLAQAEALASALPMATSSTIDLAEDLREADAAVLVPPAAGPLAKAIAMLEADRERRQALAKRGKAWADRNCDPDRAGTRFREFYQSILDEQRGTNR